MLKRISNRITLWLVMGCVLGYIPDAYAANTTHQLSLGVDSSGNSRGNVFVRQIGQPVAASQLQTLIQQADRSTVGYNPFSNKTGSFHAGDHVAFTNNLMVWFDCTREQGYWSGGGGMLRGVWRLHRNEDGVLDFVYRVGSTGWAPNCLFVGQAGGNGRGDSWQILTVKSGGIDPDDTYRATSSAQVVVLDSGTYDASTNSLSYHFRGVMTQGKGTTDYGWSENIGTNSNPAKMNYHAYYTIYNNAQGNNGYRIASDFTVDVAAAANLNQTTNIKSIVFSLGMSRTSVDDIMRLDYLKPVNLTIRRGNWSRNNNGVWTNDNPDFTTPGQLRFVPEFNKYVIGNVFRNSGAVVDMKYPSTNGQNFPNELRLRMRSSVNCSGSNFNIFNIGSYFQYIYDQPNYNFVHDIKIGDPNQEGAIGVMQQGWVVRSFNDMYFDYTNK